MGEAQAEGSGLVWGDLGWRARAEEAREAGGGAVGEVQVAQVKLLP